MGPARKLGEIRDHYNTYRLGCSFDAGHPRNAPAHAHLVPPRVMVTLGGNIVVAFASHLPNGNTLITDSNNNRVVEVDPHDLVVSEYITNTMPGSNATPLPTRAVRLRNGNTLISGQFNNRVIEVTAASQIVFEQGKLNVARNGFNEVNGPTMQRSLVISRV